MKKLSFILGYIITALLITSFLFKVLQWPGASILLVIASIGLIIILLPLTFLYFYNKELSGFVSYKLKYIFGFLGVAIFLTASLFKMLHLPGAVILLVLSAAVINFGYLPFLFYRMYKKSIE